MKSYGKYILMGFGIVLVACLICLLMGLPRFHNRDKDNDVSRYSGSGR